MSLPAPYYSKDNVTLYHGDNVAVMSEMEAESIDLVVTSPPYDNLRAYDGYSWDFEQVAQQLWRVIKTGGVVVWNVNDATIDGCETGTSFRQALRFMEIGFRLHDTMIYRKSNPIPLTHNRYEQEWEYCFVFSRKAPKAWNPLRKRNKNAGQSCSWSSPALASNAARRSRDEITTTKEESYRGNIWEYSVGSECGKHPAVFPEALARDHILSWSNEGDTVLDCFSGSGTTVKMARDNGRRAIGIEISQKYLDISVKRLAQRVLNFQEVAS